MWFKKNKIHAQCHANESTCLAGTAVQTEIQADRQKRLSMALLGQRVRVVWF